MNYKNKVSSISDLFTLHGSFAPLSEKPLSTENGFTVEGEGLSIRSEFYPHSSGVTRRADSIKNTSSEPISLRSALSKFVFNGGEYEVYTQRCFWCAERYGSWQPLVTEVCASNDEVRANAGAAPFVAIYNLQNRRGVAFHILSDGKWRFRVRNFYTQTGQKKNLTVELGLDDSDLDLVLSPGESLELPSVLYYEFCEKNDMDAYKLHRYCNDVYPTRRMPVTYNSWMSKFDNISYDILSEQLKRAAELGCEYFVIDAGWFGRPNAWYDSAGDWVECKEASMAGRMSEFADRVRDVGLKFGLWFEIERASLTSDAYAAHPEYYLVEDGYAFVNFASPEACEYIKGVLFEQIDKYGIEYVKFDFNAVLTYDPERRSFNSYFKGYRDFISSIRERYPNIYLENCASGGMRMALSSLEGFDSFWMSDDHSLYNQLEIFKSAMIRMPSNALETWMTVRSLEQFEPVYGGGISEKILMSGDAGWGHIEALSEDYLKAVAVGGPVCISCDLTKLSQKLFETLRSIISEHKAQRDFWQRSECRILCDTDSLTVLQYNDPSFEKIKIFSFSKLPIQNLTTIYPVTDGGDYELDGKILSAAELSSEGIDLDVSKRFGANSLTLDRK